MDKNPNRQPTGVPTGGQYAAQARAEGTADLTDTEQPAPPPRPEVDTLADSIRGEIGSGLLTPHSVAQALRAAGRPVGDQTVLDVYEKLTSERVRGVAESPAQKLTALANSNDPYVRGAVAGNEHTPVQTLRAMAQNEGDDMVEQFLMGNPSTPGDALDAIVQRRMANTDVLFDSHIQDVASHRNTTPATLAAIYERYRAGDDDHAVKSRKSAFKGLAGNPNTPSHVLEAVACEDDQLQGRTLGTIRALGS